MKYTPIKIVMIEISTKLLFVNYTAQEESLKTIGAALVCPPKTVKYCSTIQGLITKTCEFTIQGLIKQTPGFWMSRPHGTFKMSCVARQSRERSVS